MLNDKIIDHFGLRKVYGDVGIEVEVECTREFYDNEPCGTKWRLTGDGSLRGISGEFVIKRPCSVGKVEENLQLIRNSIESCNSSIKDSIRAGVHVHVNCQQLTIRQMFNFALIYYLMETPLTKFCGPNRVGNMFCLRLQDAEFPLTCMEFSIERGNIRQLRSDNIRYAALNFNSLFKYGSLEFRAMQTRPDLSGISDFASMLCKIRDYAMDLDGNITDIIEQYSFEGPASWMRSVLGEDHFAMLNYEGIDDEMFEDFRRVQPVMYQLGAEQ